MNSKNTDMQKHLEEIDQWIACLLLGRLITMDPSGILVGLTPWRSEDLFESLQIDPMFERWWRECMRILEEHHLIQKNNDLYKLRKSPSQLVQDTIGVNCSSDSGLLSDLRRAWDVKRTEYLDNQDIGVAVRLTESCLEALDDILKGNINATNILFPDSSMEKVEDLYQRNIISDYYNEMVADIVERYFKSRLKRDPGTKISILEIGAGTGATTSVSRSIWPVFPKTVRVPKAATATVTSVS